MRRAKVCIILVLVYFCYFGDVGEFLPLTAACVDRPGIPRVKGNAKIGVLKHSTLKERSRRFSKVGKACFGKEASVFCVAILFFLLHRLRVTKKYSACGV